MQKIIESFYIDHPAISQLHTIFVASFSEELRTMRPRFALRHDPKGKVSSDRIVELCGLDCD